MENKSSKKKIIIGIIIAVFVIAAIVAAVCISKNADKVSSNNAATDATISDYDFKDGDNAKDKKKSDADKAKENAKSQKDKKKSKAELKKEKKKKDTAFDDIEVVEGGSKSKKDKQVLYKRNKKGEIVTKKNGEKVTRKPEYAGEDEGWSPIVSPDDLKKDRKK